MFVFFATLSDRFKVRSYFMLLANVFGIIGYVLFLTPTPQAVKYFGTFMCAIAVYTGPGLNLTWLNVNSAPHYRRATAIGVQQSIGNTAGIVAGQIYRKAPYKLGNGISLGAICVSQFIIVAKIFYIKRMNAQKKKIAAGVIEDNRSVRDGDKDVDFIYHL